MEKARTVVIGPGLGEEQHSQSLVKFVTSSEKTLVIDADALKYLNGKAREAQTWVLTPHAAEASQLLDTTVDWIETHRFEAVKQIAQQYHCVCVLKGPGSLISDGKRYGLIKQVIQVWLVAEWGMC